MLMHFSMREGWVKDRLEINHLQWYYFLFFVQFTFLIVMTEINILSCNVNGSKVQSSFIRHILNYTEYNQ